MRRQRYCIVSQEDVHIRLKSGDDGGAVNFSSNDYLGLSQDPRLIRAMCESAKMYGVGARGSRLICGYYAPEQLFEEQFSDWLGYETARLFNSGYSANLAMVSLLAQDRQTAFVLDQCVHQSILSAVQQSGRPWCRYRHQNLQSLEQQLSRFVDHQVWIITEGVFSMQGQITPLDKIVHIARAAGARIYCDDAHSIGVLGAGHGILGEKNLTASDVDVLICPLGKAFGSVGGMVLGPKSILSQIEQQSKHYIYSTGLPVPNIAANHAALDIIQSEHAQRQQLSAHMQQLQKAGIACETPIVMVPVGDAEKATYMSKQLLAAGYFVRAILPPTLQQPALRVVLNANHTPEMISGLLTAIQEVQCQSFTV